MRSLACYLLSGSVGHPSWDNMSETLDVLWYLPVTQRAARRWTSSILEMFVAVYGSQTVQEYSSFGLTRVLYAMVFMCCDGALMFLRRKPRVELADCVILLM